MSTENTERCPGCEQDICKRRASWHDYIVTLESWIKSASTANHDTMEAALKTFSDEYKACYARIDLRLESLKHSTAALEASQ